MSLVGFAIVGKRNEPLYLCDCVGLVPPPPPADGGDDGDGDDGDNTEEDENDNTEDNEKKKDDSTTNDDVDDDPFGFVEMTRREGQKESMPMEHRFVLHSALDRVEERIETTSAGLPVPRGRTGAWLGLLLSRCTITESGGPSKKKNEGGGGSRSGREEEENSAATTNKADDDDNSGEIGGGGGGGNGCVYGYVTATRVKFLWLTDAPAKESDIRGLCATVHEHYIEYCMNPFCNVRETVQSKLFDRRIVDEVRNYQMNRTYEI